MNKISTMVLLVSLLATASGCANGRIAGSEANRYAAPDDPIPSGDGFATAGDLDAAAQQLLAKMRAHEAFKAGYADILAKAGGLPILAVDEIDCPARLPFASKCRLRLLRENLIASAFESGLFRVYDNAEKGHENAHLVLRGSLTCVRESAGYNLYRLQLRVKDVRTGLIVWTGAETIVKRG